jgi:predicted DNA-binding transcriptional regulator AlpA
MSVCAASLAEPLPSILINHLSVVLDRCGVTHYTYDMAQSQLAFPNNVLPVGAAEVATRLGVKPQTVHTWRHRNLMPAPRWTVSGQPAWDWAEIEAWAKRTGRLRQDDIYTDILALEGSGWEGSLEQMRTDRVAKS